MENPPDDCEGDLKSISLTHDTEFNEDLSDRDQKTTQYLKPRQNESKLKIKKKNINYNAQFQAKLKQKGGEIKIKIENSAKNTFSSPNSQRSSVVDIQNKMVKTNNNAARGRKRPGDRTVLKQNDDLMHLNIEEKPVQINLKPSGIPYRNLRPKPKVIHPLSPPASRLQQSLFFNEPEMPSAIFPYNNFQDWLVLSQLNLESVPPIN